MGFCEICEGELGLLGILGNLLHLACRNCGMHFSREATEEDLELINSVEDEE